jgi:hypothetical protein
MLHRKVSLLYEFAIMDSDSDEGQPTLYTLRRASRRARLPAPELDPYHLLSEDSETQRLLNDSYDNGAISDESVHLGYLERLLAQRLRRKSPAYPYSGALLRSVNNPHDDISKNW